MSSLSSGESATSKEVSVVYLMSHLYTHYRVVSNAKIKLPEGGSGCFRLLCIFYCSSCRLCNKVMKVVSFRAPKKVVFLSKHLNLRLPPLEISGSEAFSATGI